FSGSGLPGDLLDLGVLLHPEPTALAPDPALLEAPERRVEEVDAVVDPDDARPDALRQRERAHRVPAVDGAAEPVGRVVGDPDRLLLVPEGDHRDDRPEDLLARDPDAVRDVAEDRGLEEVAALQVLRPASAGRERGALLPSRGDVLLDLRP